MTGKKKLLFLEYFPFMGGGQKVLLDLIAGLKMRYDIEALVMNHGMMEAALEKNRVKTHFLQAPGKVKYRYFNQYLPFFIKLNRFLKENKYDLVYSGSLFASKLAGPSCLVNKIPLIWHKQLIIEKSYYSYNASQARLVSGFAKRIICVSEASRLSMIRAGVALEKLITIHNGVKIPRGPMSKARMKFRKKFRVGGNFVCGTVCIFRRNKGLEMLIDAAEIISKAAMHDMKFVLVGRADSGEEWFEEKLREKVKEKKLKNFIFAGYGDKYAFMPGFDLYVMPSPMEPFGLVTIEAMGIGVPAAGFNTGGTAEIITDGKDGFLAGQVSPRALAEKIIYAYKNRKKLGAMSKKAAASVKEKFSLEKQTAAVRGVIEACIK
ncbi:MAG: glycosyltransferase family 4 protein [Candidatus Goldiibacteriota bacterium]